MSSNGKALVATAIAGLMVIGTVYWWKRSDDNPDTPRAGCTTVVVTASVEKSDL
ncbi:MAG: Ca-activated chloride channel, partial [Mycobacterium sp.]|nr:Ca-activated chloride channel [Mycobacterium sp.]